jgi:hypothetical protein
LQTLKNFTEILPEKKGIEKSLWIRKFIKRIDYSKEEIALSLYYKGNHGAALKISTSDQTKKNDDRNLNLSNPKVSPETLDYSLKNAKWLRNMNFNQTVSIILPNTIHACKKNL